jgi:hypothetical protein
MKQTQDIRPKFTMLRLREVLRLLINGNCIQFQFNSINEMKKNIPGRHVKNIFVSNILPSVI